MKYVLLFIAVNLSLSVGAVKELKGHYEVDDSGVITNDAVALKSCNKQMLDLYGVNKNLCLVAAKKCLAELELNKIDLEANPMYHMNCLMKEFNIKLEALLTK